jgi:zinc transporter ZupT
LDLIILESAPEIQYHIAILWSLLGITIMAVIEKIIPHEEEDIVPQSATSSGTTDPSPKTDVSTVSQTKTKRKLFDRHALITYTIMAVHHLPEGVSVAVTTASDLKIGVSLCCAILIHNILEGMVVALPLYRSSQSTLKVLFLTLVNGMMQPVGVLIAWALAGSAWLENPKTVGILLAVVGGLMIGISVFELVPSSLKHMKKPRRTRLVLWIIAGMVLGVIIIGGSELIMHVVTSRE